MGDDTKVALVTGASRGIGKASALALADAGFDVAITARTVNEGEGRTEANSVRGDDPIVPMANARLICGLIPDAQLKVMDCGHLFLLTRAEESARAIERFLDRGDETCSR